MGQTGRISEGPKQEGVQGSRFRNILILIVIVIVIVILILIVIVISTTKRTKKAR